MGESEKRGSGVGEPRADKTPDVEVAKQAADAKEQIDAVVAEIHKLDKVTSAAPALFGAGRFTGADPDVDVGQKAIVRAIAAQRDDYGTGARIPLGMHGDPAHPSEDAVPIDPAGVARAPTRGSADRPTPSEDAVPIDPGDVIRRPTGPFSRDYNVVQIALALSGGGSKGDFELGACGYLYRHWLPANRAGLGARPDICTGTSVGAINAAFLAEGEERSYDQLRDIWFGLVRNSDMYQLALDLDAIEGGATAALAEGLSVSLFGMFGGPAGLLLLLVANEVVLSQLRPLYEVLRDARSVYHLGPIALRAQAREADWSPAGPGMRGASIAVTRDSTGRCLLFARGYDDRCWVRWQTAPSPTLPAAESDWSDWLDLGGPISSDPVALRDRDGAVGVVARTGDRRMLTSRWRSTDDATRAAGAWRAWETVPSDSDSPAEIASTPAAARLINGRPLVTRREANGSLAVAERQRDHWENWSEAPSFPPRIPPTPPVGKVTVADWLDDGSRVLLARRSDGVVHQSIAPAGGDFGVWQSLGSVATSDLTVVGSHVGSRYLLWRGPGSDVLVRRRNPAAASGWDPEESLGGRVVSNVAAVETESAIKAYVRGLDGGVWVAERPASGAAFGDWRPLGGPRDRRVLADPIALQAGRDTVEVFAVASDKAVWHCTDDGRSPASWSSLGGTVWTGVQLRMATVALEDGEVRYVDEAGQFAGIDEPLATRTQGIIASAAIPAIFPAVPINGRAWVDGGVARGIPIGAAIEAGADFVVAVSASAAVPDPRTEILPLTVDDLVDELTGGEVHDPGFRQSHQVITDYTNANVADVSARAIEDLLPGEILQSELVPETPWGRDVYVVQPTFNVHDALTIDPGLIRIAHDYGWMRAEDVLEARDPAEAAATSDQITLLRRRVWAAETELLFLWWALTYRPFRERLELGSRRRVVQFERLTSEGWQPFESAVRDIRAGKRAVATAIAARREVMGMTDPLPLPPDIEQWARTWELHGPPRPAPEWPEQWTPNVRPLMPEQLWGPWTFDDYDGRRLASMAADPLGPPSV